MSGPQYIVLILIAIVTWGAFVESSSDPPRRVAFGRFAIALAFPLLLATLVALPPWEDWIAAPSRWHLLPWIDTLMSLLLVPVMAIGIQVLAVALVFSIVAWVSMALSGEISNWSRVLLSRIGRRAKP